MKRLLGVFLTLCFLVATLVAAPLQASAAANWNVLEVSPSSTTISMSVVPNGEETPTIMTCGNNSDTTTYYVNEVNGNGITGAYPADGKFTCIGTTGPDGTVYGTYYDTSTSKTYLAAVKNSRIKWMTNIDSVVCGMSGERSMTPRGLSIGADGNVYMTTSSPYSYYGCANYALGLNANDGTIMFSAYLGAGGANTVPANVWTYDDRIVAVGTNGLQHEYSYAGVENTSAQYQFTITGGGDLYANKDGRVFLVGTCIGYVASISYHDRNGDNGAMARSDCGGPSQMYNTGPNGKLVAYYNTGAIYTYDIPNGTYAYNAPTIPDGYTGYYWVSPGAVYLREDADGNILLARQLNTTTGKNSVFVDVIDKATGATTNLFTREGDGTNTNKEEAYVPDFQGGNLYFPVSHSMESTTYARDIWIHKIDISGSAFGTPIDQGPGFAHYVGTKRDYVAMGDSFSGGEGNPPFTSISDSSTDQCHRSNASYPELLDADPSANLNLTGFVACTGAKTSNVSGGQNGEPAQVDALTGGTKIVTITIGGNDVLFGDYLRSCITLVCGPVTAPSVYGAMMGRIDAASFKTDLETTYTTILSKAPAAELYVADYPYIANSDETMCDAVDLTGAFDIETELNSVIHSAISDVAATNPHIHAVHTNAQGSPFIGKNVCGGDSYFYSDIILPISEQVYSYHPNSAGQAAYEAILKGQIPTN